MATRPAISITAPGAERKREPDTHAAVRPVRNGRCRMHGGKSTGPRTEAGLERCREAHRKTGRYSQVHIKYRKIVLEITRCVHSGRDRESQSEGGFGVRSGAT
jgi:hypothetical protein